MQYMIPLTATVTVAKYPLQSAVRSQLLHRSARDAPRLSSEQPIGNTREFNELTDYIITSGKNTVNDFPYGREIGRVTGVRVNFRLRLGRRLR